MCLQKTEICIAAKPETGRRHREEEPLKFQRYKLTLNKGVKPLTQFSDVNELLTAFTDAVEAHHKAFESAHILHRDISPGNVMIDENGRGILVDWELSEFNLERHEARLTKLIGTWQFIAYRLIAGRKENEPIPVHVKDDDLESFWHVLFWVAMRHCEHGQSIPDIESIMTRVYNNRQFSETGISCTQLKMILLTGTTTVRGPNFASLPLKTVLENYRRIIGSRYQLDEQEKEKFLSWNEQVKKDTPQATNSEILSRLDSLMWEDEFFPSLYSRPLVSFFLKDNWALELCRDVLATTTEVDWIIGVANKFRPELFSTVERSRYRERQAFPS